MRQLERLVKRHIKRIFPDYSVAASIPSWIEDKHWKPCFLLESAEQRMVLAIDIIPSGTVPQFQYNTIVTRLLADHNNFRVIIVTLEESYEENPEIEQFCSEYKLGLKVVIPGIGVQTIVRIDLDPGLEVKELPLEDGWFPRAILEKARNLTRLCFHETIDKFIDSAEKLGNDRDRTLALVRATIDELLRFHPAFRSSIKHFMKLEHFEKLLRLGDPESSDHVFHSFRVFLSGCPIINEFYDKFHAAHARYCIGPVKKLRVEYSWLLTAIFHDIGRPKEKEVVTEFVENELSNEYLKVSVSIDVDENMWAEEHYVATKRVLGSLGAYVAQGLCGDNWDGGALDDEEAKRIIHEWINLYDSLESHAIISGFDFFADITRKCRAANMRGSRPFVLTHAAPAALAILLHDWKKWPKQRKLKLIPVDGRILPMAALLIYIDTWDNYKRRSEIDPLTYIKSYEVNTEGASVQVVWGDSSKMQQDALGYKAYRKALENLGYTLDIEYGMVGTI